MLFHQINLIKMMRGCFVGQRDLVPEVKSLSCPVENIKISITMLFQNNTLLLELQLFHQINLIKMMRGALSAKVLIRATYNFKFLPPGMKFYDKFVVSRLEATRKVLFLRYGVEEPCKKCPPSELLSFSDIAKIMKINKG